MNKVYKSVWNESIGAWVAVSENSPARGKSSAKKIAVKVASTSAALGAAIGMMSPISALAQYAPDLGGEDGGVESCSGSNMQSCDPWNPRLGAVSGSLGQLAAGLAAADDNYVHVNSTLDDSSAIGTESVAIGGAATANVNGDISIGSSSSATGGADANGSAVAMGAHATASSMQALAIGTGALASSNGDVAIGTFADATGTGAYGSATAVGFAATANGKLASALGYRATATGASSVALGANSVADVDNTISVGSSTKQRRIVNVAAGTQAHDAVNVTQLQDITALLGGEAKVNADGTMTAPSYSIGAKSYNNVGDALTALNSTSKYLAAIDAATNANGGTAIGVGSLAIGGNATADSTGGSEAALALGSDSLASAKATALGPGATASASGSVSIGTRSVADRANTVSVGNSTVQRQLVQVARGTQATDAVNLSQLTPVIAALGGTAALKSDGTMTAPSYTIGATSYDNVGDALSALAGGSGKTKYFNANSTLADSSVTGADSVAIGGAAVASAKNAVALGSNSVADRANTVSVGAAGKERQITNVAAGTTSTDAVNLAQLTTVSQTVTDLDSFAVKYDTAAGQPNYESITLGGAGAADPTKITNLKIGDLSSTSTDAINGSQLYSTNQRVGSLETFETNINNGGGVKYFHTNSTLADSSATGADSVAVGGAAVASAKNAVALGSNSVADRANTVSVGAAGKERQITNVAAGTALTDAVNVGQLTAISNNVDTLGSFAVKYDTDANGAPDYEQITLGGAGATKPTLLTNVKAGELKADSTDAVNGSQLYTTNTNVAALQDFTNNINNGGGVKYFHANSTLADSSATGADSVAIGGAALSSGKNSVALGSNSVADRDNSVSVGAAGSERQITNVAAGTASTDAANVGQLNAVSSSVTALGASAIKYDTNADGTPDYANATLGNGNASGTALHNVAAGTSNMDAVNLGQINDMIGQVTNLANGAYNPMFTADGSRDTEAATSSGTHSVASGANAVASGANAVASGASSLASGANTVAVGANASATAKNAVALGAGSVADRANSVSVGTSAAGGQRQITNVEAGTEGTDAVNVNQMQQSVNTGVKSAKGYTDALRADMNSSLSIQNNHINSVGAMSSAMAMMAGSAAAIADKDNRFAAGTGVYRDKAAIAIGFQKRFGTNMVLTVGGSTTGEESTGGAGFAFGF